MGLLQVATSTVTSAVSSVTLTGISEDCPYLFTANNVISVNDGTTLRARVTVGGTAQTGTNYARANKELKANTSFSNDSATQSAFYIANTIGSDTNEQQNFILYLYNFYSSSEFPFILNEVVGITSSGNLQGRQGGGVYTATAQSNDGLQFFAGSGNLEAGTFSLYKVV
tara:strand:+ start:26 stop:532 length:507 start_codon:yes stop_codon:yes gene_type:complete